MRASWHALHAGLTRSTTTLRFQRQFEMLGSEMPELTRFSDPAALFDWLHARNGDGPARNVVLTALARSAKAKAEPAVTLLLLALWPGLDAVQGRLAGSFRDPGELASRLALRVVQNIHALDLAAVTWVAATLVRNAERDVRRDLIAARVREARREVEIHARSGVASPLVLPDGLDADEAASILTLRLVPVVGADADLVVDVAVRGERQHEAAARLGSTPAATRKRYQRAIGRLRKEFGAAA